MSSAKDHVSTRLAPAIIERLDTLAPLMAPLGTTPNRSVVVRACVLVGLDVLEGQYLPKQ